MKRERIRSIDAARGTAMLFVFFSHFAQVYFRRNGQLSLLSLAYDITMVASPTFVVISGVMLGYFWKTRFQGFGDLKEKYFGRGLFLLTVGHVLILVAHVFFVSGFKQALHWGFMTDAIGFCLILGPLVIQHLQLKRRLFLSVIMFIVSWILILFWSPSPYILRILKEACIGPVGTFDKHLFTDIFPFFPWFSIYIAGTCIGELMAEYLARGQGPKISAIILKIGLISIVVAILKMGLKVLLFPASDSRNGVGVQTLLSLSQKSPPSIIYFLFYGGVGLMILAVLLRFEKVAPVRRYSEFAGVIGRTSLFVFIIQYYVYFAFFSVVNLRYTTAWPLYFIASVALIYGASVFWDKARFNRFLTIPLLPPPSRTTSALEGS